MALGSATLLLPTDPWTAFIMLLQQNLDYRYLAYRAASVLSRPICLWVTVLWNPPLAELVAQLLVIGQVLLYSTGTQIHKKFMSGEINLTSFRAVSFSEGLILAPLGVIAVLIIASNNFFFIIYVLAITPLEKVLEDYQRELSYSARNRDMAFFALLRSLTWPLSCGAFWLLDLYENTNALLILGFIYTIFLFKLKKISLTVTVKTFYSACRHLYSSGLQGITWSVLTGMLMQYDKFLVSSFDGELAEYMLRYQIVQLAFVAYSVVLFIPSRYLAVNSVETFRDRLNASLVWFYILLIFLFGCGELVARKTEMLPEIGLDLAIIQAVLVALLIWGHGYVEEAFWQLPMRSMLIFEASIFLAGAGVLIATFAFAEALSVVLTALCIVMLLRTVLLKRCV